MNLEIDLDYYAGGMLLPGRNYNSNTYRFGFNGQEKDDEITGTTGSHYTAMFWEYDSRIGRRWNIDPVMKPWESSYSTFSNNPIWFTDPLGNDTIKFGEDNKYSSTVKAKGTNVGQKLGKEGFNFNFADPVNDPKNIGNKKGQINELYIADNKDMLDDLERAGVNKEENRGLIDGPNYLLNQSDVSQGDGKLDFKVTSELLLPKELKGTGALAPFSDNLLYIVKAGDVYYGQNKDNFGNFLWGASANALQVPLPGALLGAHLNNFFFDAHYKGTLDSKDDQFSIALGWLWRQSLKK